MINDIPQDYLKVIDEEINQNSGEDNFCESSH
jgi:hypothetical protein